MKGRPEGSLVFLEDLEGRKEVSNGRSDIRISLSLDGISREGKCCFLVCGTRKRELREGVTRRKFSSLVVWRERINRR